MTNQLITVFQKHINTVHDKIKDFYCIMCGNSTFGKYDLKHHTKIEHQFKKDSMVSKGMDCDLKSTI